MSDLAGGTTTEIPEYPMARAAGCPFDPPPALRSLQQAGPLTKVRLWDGSEPWLVTDHTEQRTLLADPRVSADPGRAGYPRQDASSGSGGSTLSFIMMDDPEHARLRRMVTAAFTVKRVEAMRPAVQKIVDGQIDAMVARPKPADLVESFALPVPSLVICELLGVPYADHEFFQTNSKALINRDSTPEQRTAASNRLVGYLDGLVGEKLTAPGNDLLSGLAIERVKTGQLARSEAAQMGVLLLFAGHETTANMIALGTLTLLQQPDQLALLQQTEDPAVIAGAVEELLRYLNIVQTGLRRAALEDIDIADHRIRAGDGLIMPTDIGNRDPDVYPDPNRVDIQRDTRRHTAFGFGVHQCLGQPLARMELQAVYSTLYRRLPRLRLATDLDQLPFKHDGFIYGVYELPVTW